MWAMCNETSSSVGKVTGYELDDRAYSQAGRECFFLSARLDPPEEWLGLRRQSGRFINLRAKPLQCTTHVRGVLLHSRHFVYT
jgi:hypothetical protein